MADVIFVALTIAVFVILGVGREGGGAAVSAENAVGLVVRRRPGGLPGRGPAVPGAVLMSPDLGGVVFIASLLLALALVLPAARRLHVPASTPAPGTPGSSGASTGWSGSTRTPSRPGASTPAACWRSRRSSILFLYAVPAAAGPPAGCRLGFDAGRARTRRGTPRSASSTNTNWQSYSGESTMGHLVQMAGLAVQNFVSAAVGIAVAVALVRGFARTPHRPARQLLGRPGPDHAADPAADRGRRARSCWSPAAWCRTSPAGTDVTTLTGGDADDHRRAGGQPGGHQGARHQRRRLLQRQLRPPVREPDRAGPTGSRSSCCC